MLLILYILAEGQLTGKKIWKNETVCKNPVTVSEKCDVDISKVTSHVIVYQ